MQKISTAKNVLFELICLSLCIWLVKKIVVNWDNCVCACVSELLIENCLPWAIHRSDVPSRIATIQSKKCLLLEGSRESNLTNLTKQRKPFADLPREHNSYEAKGWRLACGLKSTRRRMLDGGQQIKVHPVRHPPSKWTPLKLRVLVSSPCQTPVLRSSHARLSLVLLTERGRTRILFHTHTNTFVSACIFNITWYIRCACMYEYIYLCLCVEGRRTRRARKDP